jgi:hypothetical protein
VTLVGAVHEGSNLVPKLETKIANRLIISQAVSIVVISCLLAALGVPIIVYGSEGSRRMTPMVGDIRTTLGSPGRDDRFASTFVRQQASVTSSFCRSRFSSASLPRYRHIASPAPTTE